jgi:hypothetical protein
MKINPAFALVTATVLAFSTVVQAQSTPLIFQAQDAVEEGNKILLPDDTKNYEFQLSDKEGISIGDKPTVGADEKSLVFSGQQKSAFVGTKSFAQASSSFGVELSFLVDPQAASLNNNGTLLKHANWEIRCDAKNGNLAVVVWHKKNVPYSIVSVPMQLGVWQRLSAKLQDGVLSLSVDGDEKQEQIANPIHPANAFSILIIGAAWPGSGDVSMESFRPFFGALADIKLTAE